MFTDSFVVNLANQTCSYNFWDLIGIPCRHTVVAIHWKIDDPINHVHKCYHKLTYVKCYKEGITPLNGQNKWPKTNDPVIYPPMFKRGPGRPKKLRRREPDESNATKWQGTNTTHRCKTCLEYVHNTRTCKKNKNIILHKNQDVKTNQVPTQESQTRNVQKATSTKGRPKGSLNKKDKVAPSKAPRKALSKALRKAPGKTPSKAPGQPPIKAQSQTPSKAKTAQPEVIDQINEAPIQASIQGSHAAQPSTDPQTALPPPSRHANTAQPPTDPQIVLPPTSPHADTAQQPIDPQTALPPPSPHVDTAPPPTDA
ncbi:unnamed protein product [Lathyrus sativus]|nr:unnamed protein product [Lathyrus sativus]